MDTKNPKSFMAAKLSARAVETSNMKNAQVFNISYTPGEIWDSLYPFSAPALILQWEGY